MNWNAEGLMGRKTWWFEYCTAPSSEGNNIDNEISNSLPEVNIAEYLAHNPTINELRVITRAYAWHMCLGWINTFKVDYYTNTVNVCEYNFKTLMNPHKAYNYSMQC